MTVTDAGYSTAELMVVELARRLRDGEVAMTGASSDVPVAACLLAQQRHAPNFTLILPSGAVNPRPGRLYRSASDGRWFDGCEGIGTAYDLFELSENHQLDVMFYGGVQIDRFGNINLTAVGRGTPPAFRGPGLANVSFAVVTKRIFLYSMNHTPRIFVPEVDYVTAPGHLTGGESRATAGIRTRGPEFCITPLGSFCYPEGTAQMTVESLHPGVEEADVDAATGFTLLGPRPYPVTPPPTAEELSTLRSVVDTTGVLRRMSQPTPTGGATR